MAYNLEKYDGVIDRMKQLSEVMSKENKKNLSDYLSGYTSMNTEPKVFTADDGYGNITYHIVSCDGKIKRRYTEHRGISNPNKSNEIVNGLINEVRSLSPTIQDMLNNTKSKISKSEQLPFEKDYWFGTPIKNEPFDIDIIEPKEIIEKPIKKNYVNHNIQELPKYIEPEKKSIFKKLFK